MSVSVVVLEEDPRRAEFLAVNLRLHFPLVYVIRSCVELLDQAGRIRAQALVVDLESTQLGSVERIHRTLPGLPIICAHRIPDDAMWAAALQAGASDVCASDDMEGIRASIMRSLAEPQSTAA